MIIVITNCDNYMFNLLKTYKNLIFYPNRIKNAFLKSFHLFLCIIAAVSFYAGIELYFWFGS